MSVPYRVVPLDDSGNDDNDDHGDNEDKKYVTVVNVDNDDTDHKDYGDNDNTCYNGGKEADNDDTYDNDERDDKDVGIILDVVNTEAFSPEEAAEYIVLERQDLWKQKVCGGTFTSCAEADAIIAAVQ